MRESADGTPLDAELIDFKAMDIDGGSTGSLDWTALSLQVQLYARAAKEILGTPVKLGSVHMLKDGVRIVIPIDAEAQDAAIGNVEWAVSGILQRDFPMRPQADKCSHCDFHLLCAQQPKDFAVSGSPPPVRVPVSGGINGELVVPALALFDRSHERV
jgi:DNA helicase-2/ATP-dependent DNA helicase PcrA